MTKEKPNPKRPQLWYQKAWKKGQCHDRYWKPSRVRIIYPNGEAWYSPIETSSQSEGTPCWRIGETSCKSSKRALVLMRKYDRLKGMDPAEFLGNL